MGVDRRDIAGILIEHFPAMGEKDAGGRILWTASSDDWHALLNSVTGLDISLGEDNGTAFDRWRRELAKLDYPVWDTTPQQEADIKARGDALLIAVKAEQEKRDMLRADALMNKLGPPNADGTVSIQ